MRARLFLLSSFQTFAALLLFNTGWFLAEPGLSALAPVRDEAQGGNSWLATPATRAGAVSAVEDLRRQLAAADSATAVLDNWCAAHGMAPAGSVVADKLPVGTSPMPPALRRLLRIDPAQAVALRHVRLRCGHHLLSEAVLWYVPGRLPDAIAARLNNSSMPFGRAVSPLHPGRRALGARTFWPSPRRGAGTETLPASLFALSALLVLPDGTPIAFVREVYQRGVLDFGPGGGDAPTAH